MRVIISSVLLIAATGFCSAQVREVATGDFFFRDAYSSTSETVIDVGMSVRWVWRAGIHTTTSVGNLWDSPLNTSNRSFQFTFNQTGEYEYFCRPHASFMRGRVKVRLPGDVDFSDCVDDADLLAVLFTFGATGPRPQDVNYDSVVDDADLLIVLFNFGSGC